jgi:hypothetical protein
VFSIITDRFCVWLGPWLDPATAGRVIFVSDPAALNDLIDPAMLNERYGGTKREEYPIIPDFDLPN